MTFEADPTQFRQALLQLLEASPPAEEPLLADLERKHRGQPFYSSVLSILTHLNFSETEARQHWRAVREHRGRLSAVLGRDPGLRVALLDYFVNVNRELTNPKVIELSIYEKTERLAVTDGLTGLFNHSYMFDALRRELLRAKRHELQVSLVMLDLDDFKNVNDTRGHLEGDRVLVKVAALMRESLREIDVAARYGGEEFAIILPDTTRTGALTVGDRIRKRVEDHFGVEHASPTVTLSGGVATYPDDALTSEELIGKADEGLYHSKAEGKNRITMVGGDRRRHARIPVNHPATISSGTGRGAAHVENVSECGLLIRLRRSVPIGSQVSLVVRPRSSRSFAFRGEVVRLKTLPSRHGVHYELGVRVLSELSETQNPLVLTTAARSRT